MNDFEAMSARCADLARQLTAMEHQRDTAVIHLRAVTEAAAAVLSEAAYYAAASQLADAIEAALETL